MEAPKEKINEHSIRISTTLLTETWDEERNGFKVQHSTRSECKSRNRRIRDEDTSDRLERDLFYSQDKATNGYKFHNRSKG